MKKTLVFLLFAAASLSAEQKLFYPGSLAILPKDGRTVFLEAFAAAKKEIRIEICVLEDPRILKSLNKALQRGVAVKVIVDNRKYESFPEEQENLAAYLTSAGGQLHLSNPIFPRSFPKVILIDNCYALIGTACLDTTTFEEYRDYVYVTDDCLIIQEMARLFKNDWRYSKTPYSTFNPTPPITVPNVIIAPVNSADQLVTFIQSARKTLDVTSELLGNPTLESELYAAVAKGVRVRLISPQFVNEATPEEQALQDASLKSLKKAGIEVHVTLPPESAKFPYMHARTAVADGKLAYIGSISLSPDSSTFNREVGLILDKPLVVQKLQGQFEIDFHKKSVNVAISANLYPISSEELCLLSLKRHPRKLKDMEFSVMSHSQENWKLKDNIHPIDILTLS